MQGLKVSLYYPLQLLFFLESYGLAEYIYSYTGLVHTVRMKNVRNEMSV